MHRHVLERRAAVGRTTELRRVEDRRDRSRLARRHLGRRRQAGQARNRRDRARALVREPGRGDQGRYAYRRVREPGEVSYQRPGRLRFDRWETRVALVAVRAWATGLANALVIRGW